MPTNFDDGVLLFYISIMLGCFILITVNLCVMFIDRFSKRKPIKGWVIFPDPKTKSWTIIAWTGKDGVIVADFESKEEAEHYARHDLAKHLYKMKNHS